MTELTEENFNKEITEYRGMALVDFWADWCGECKALAPAFEEASEEAAGVKFCKFDCSNNQEFASDFGIMGIPTLLLFNNGKVVNKRVGVCSKQDIIDML